jgi:hypothetical protein
MPKPAIGRIVHYLDPTAVGDEEPNAIRCRAAIITEIVTDDEFVALCVLRPDGQSFMPLVVHDEGGTSVTLPGVKQIRTWHWPERDEDPVDVDSVASTLGQSIKDALAGLSFEMKVDQQGIAKIVARGTKLNGRSGN